MSAGPAGKLYSPELLSLATELASYPLSDGLTLRQEERSRTCGSTIVLGLSTAGGGMVDAVGMQVSACAVGQASAAIMARGIVGSAPHTVIETYEQILHWLAGEGALPQWPGFTALEAARDYAGRHGALLLPWKAAAEALSKVTPTS
ncbi:iron-sulfur cluster assembly scaffold protein [Altererythrobacter sp.]|uniref:iron-sulfur cluster assembly scaffold protein n=1 Tax=Altererythrobacter sp. TaxID=1872480 RepID=UPI003D032663